MSHFKVLVVSQTPEQVEQLLAPYAEEGEWFRPADEERPESRWDWWQLGGRWSGFFRLKPGAEGALGEPGAFENQPRPGYTDQARKRDIDFSFMRDRAGMEAGDAWDRYASVVEGTPPATPWREFLGRIERSGGMPRPIPEDLEVGEIESFMEAEKHRVQQAVATGAYTITQARDDYHAQPRMKAIHEHDRRMVAEKRFGECLLGFLGGPEDYADTREEHVQNARDRAVSVHALLDEKGWREQARMGWFGMTVDEEADPNAWGRAIAEYIDALPDDALLSLVDCHV